MPAKPGWSFNVRVDVLMQELEFQERTIRVNRVAKVVKGGRRFSFSALIVIGNANGKVGIGYGKAKEASVAVAKGIEDAKKNMFTVPLAGSTIIHPIIGEFGAGRVLLKPAAAGTGVIAGGAVRSILEMAGVHDVLAKSLGSSNSLNIAYATIAGLKALKRPEEIAKLRGKQIAEVVPVGVLRAYNKRQQEIDAAAGMDITYMSDGIDVLDTGETAGSGETQQQQEG